MIRTLLLVAVVSFGLTIGFMSAAFAVTGGPFFIDDEWRFHKTVLSEIEVDHRPPALVQVSYTSP